MNEKKKNNRTEQNTFEELKYVKKNKREWSEVNKRKMKNTNFRFMLRYMKNL